LMATPAYFTHRLQRKYRFWICSGLASQGAQQRQSSSPAKGISSRLASTKKGNIHRLQ
jgi:hypothetical protein